MASGQAGKLQISRHESTRWRMNEFRRRIMLPLLIVDNRTDY